MWLVRFVDVPRQDDRRGGGTGLVYRDSIKVNKAASGDLGSFEFSEWLVQLGSEKLRLCIVYRPPYSQNHPVSIATFFKQFEDYLESVITCKQKLLLAGDFNLHMDLEDDMNTKHFNTVVVEILLTIGCQTWHISHKYNTTKMIQ